MNKSPATYLALAGLAFLAACGGGGGGGGASAPAVSSTAPVSGGTTPRTQAGAYFTYRNTAVVSTNGAPGTNAVTYTTALVTSVGADGSYAEDYLISSPSAEKYAGTYSANNEITGMQFWLSADGSISRSCTVTPPLLTVPASLGAGSSWSSSTSMNCPYPPPYTSQSFTSQESISGNYIGTESVTVPAGTFNALKYALTIKDATTTAGLTQPNITSSETDTCWRDPVTGFDVKCEVDQTISIGTTTVTTTHGQNTRELVAYSQAPVAAQQTLAATYAGGWTGTYNGGDHGTCSMTVDVSGTIYGGCGGGAAGVLTISGTVDASGNLTFNITSSGGISPTFTGRFTSPEALVGTWASSTGATGTWALAHN